MPAAGLAIIGLVQGAGVSQAFPDPDGTYSNISRDFVGQGVANLASGIVGGIPVGGSASGTALVVSAGARSRLAGVVSGCVVALAVLALAPVVALLPMPALAGLLVLAGLKAINPERIGMVLRTGWQATLTMLVPFVATVLLPIPVAVGLGVALSIVVGSRSTSSTSTSRGSRTTQRRRRSSAR